MVSNVTPSLREGEMSASPLVVPLRFNGPGDTADDELRLRCENPGEVEEEDEIEVGFRDARSDGIRPDDTLTKWCL